MSAVDVEVISPAPQVIEVVVAGMQGPVGPVGPQGQNVTITTFMSEAAFGAYTPAATELAVLIGA